MAPNDGRIATGDWALLGLLSVLWGGSFCFNGVVLKELPPLTVVFVRVVLASLMLLPLLRYKALSFPSDISGWTPFVAMALFNNVLPFGLILTAQTEITGGLASILIATTPLFTVLIMAAAGEEDLSARRIAGVSLGLIGVMILRGNDFGLHDGHAVGILLCLAAAFATEFRRCSAGACCPLRRRWPPQRSRCWSPASCCGDFSRSASSSHGACRCRVQPRCWRSLDWRRCRRRLPTWCFFWSCSARVRPMSCSSP